MVFFKIIRAILNFLTYLLLIRVNLIDFNQKQR
jgi:hypothetical protein